MCATSLAVAGTWWTFGFVSATVLVVATVAVVVWAAVNEPPAEEEEW